MLPNRLGVVQGSIKDNCSPLAREQMRKKSPTAGLRRYYRHKSCLKNNSTRNCVVRHN